MRRAGVLALFAILALAYLSPGPAAMFDRRVDAVMSDGTDAATLPYQYGVVVDTWRTHPLRLLYGAVATTQLNAPEGFALWVTWSERWIVVLASPFFPLEQLSTAFVVALLVLNALAMYALGRRLNWSRSLAIAMSIAYAFSAYTRARAKVHMSLAGIYHLPLVFLGLVVVAKGKTWKSMAAGAACFLLAMTVAHYYIVTLAFLSPFLLAFALLSAGSPREWPRAMLRLSAAALPAILFVGWCYLEPVPAGVLASGTRVLPSTGEVKAGEVHPFLTRFAARPVDYWTGDVGLGQSDWNPIRQALTRSALAAPDSIPHERANGIRWAIWALALAALVAAFHPSTRALWPAPDRQQWLAVAAFTAFAFWLSLSPNTPFDKAGPSYWLYRLVSQIRVPSRAGVCVQFGVILMAGLFFHQVFEVPPPPAGKKERQPRWPFASGVRWLAAPAVLPLVMIAELPPFVQDMPMARIKPAHAALQGQGTGAGVYFPYASGNWQLREYYDFLQQMRGTQVQILNAASPTARDQWFLNRVALTAQSIDAVKSNDPAVGAVLQRLKSCVPITWVVFDTQVMAPQRQALCASLGWRLSGDGVCRAAALSAPIAKLPEACF